MYYRFKGKKNKATLSIFVDANSDYKKAFFDKASGNPNLGSIEDWEYVGMWNNECVITPQKNIDNYHGILAFINRRGGMGTWPSFFIEDDLEPIVDTFHTKLTSTPFIGCGMAGENLTYLNHNTIRFSKKELESILNYMKNDDSLMITVPNHVNLAVYPKAKIKLLK